ncbi:MAG: carbohydrate kinase [Cyanobacteriota bacterium]
MEKKKITTIGEALIDWVCLDKTTDLYEATNFLKAPGGAPANTAVGLAKLNYPVQFLGGFSSDIFGVWLKEFLSSYSVDISISITIPESNTRNAYVLTDKNGNRVFKGFSKYCCADSMMNFQDVNIDTITESPIVYFGSLLQASESSRFTISNIINSLRSDNITVYDPNLRPFLWNNLDEAIRVIKDTLSVVDIVKLSDDEIELIFKKDNIEEASKEIFEEYNLKLLVITLGSKGSYYINKQGSGFVKSYKVESVEVTGAGDAFVAGLLGGLYDVIIEEQADYTSLDLLIDKLSCKKIESIMKRANAIGALTTTKHGATSALPTREELEKFFEIHG